MSIGVPAVAAPTPSQETVDCSRLGLAASERRSGDETVDR